MATLEDRIKGFIDLIAADIKAFRTSHPRDYVGSTPAAPGSGTSLDWTPDGKSLYMEAADSSVTLIGPHYTIIPFTYFGPVSVRTGTQRLPIAAGTYTIVAVAAMANTAPTGASLIVDVNKNGTTIFSTQSNRPTIAASGNSATVGSMSTTSVTTGDYLTVDVDQVGSTVTGSDLSVAIYLVRTA